MSAIRPSRKLTQRGLALPIIILIILVLILAGVVLWNTPAGGGSVQSYSLSAGPGTLSVGSTHQYTVTVTLDAPAALPGFQQLWIGLFGGAVPPAFGNFEFDLVEADGGWDDTLHNNVVIPVPWGATTATKNVPITCKTIDIIEGQTGLLSDAEPSHQLRVEGWGDVLPVESGISNLTCVTTPPPPPPPPPVQCSGACGINVVETITIAAPCPPCNLEQPNAQLQAGVNLVRNGATAQADAQCTGDNCYCHASLNTVSISNCRESNNQCRIDVSFSTSGTCLSR